MSTMSTLANPQFNIKAKAPYWARIFLILFTMYKRRWQCPKQTYAYATLRARLLIGLKCEDMMEKVMEMGGEATSCSEFLSNKTNVCVCVCVCWHDGQPTHLCALRVQTRTLL